MIPTISVFGIFQNGKSTLINCLLKRDIANVGGMGLAVTKNNIRYVYGDSISYNVRKSDGTEFPLQPDYEESSINQDDELVISVPDKLLLNFSIVDTPGFNAEERDNKAAESMLTKTDFGILLLHNKGLSEDEKQIAKMLVQNKIPFIVIINCDNDIFENWNPIYDGNFTIYESIKSRLSSTGFSPFKLKGCECVFIVNLMWYWLSLKESKYSINKNKHIVKCAKFIEQNWDYYFETRFSDCELRNRSQFFVVERFLSNKSILQYLHILCIIKKFDYQCNKILQTRLKEIDGFRNEFLSQKIYNIRTVHNGYYNIMNNQIYHLKKRIDKLIQRAKTSTFYTYTGNNYIVRELEDCERKIINNKNYTIAMIEIYESLKIK